VPTIQAFHGIRYDLGHVGSLSDVIAPPYDVIDEAMQKELYERHPANAVRLILNRSEPGDQGDEKYKRAASFLKNWQQEGVLSKEPQAAIYAYQQIFTWEGEEFTRSGFMSRVRLEPFGTGKIYAHEETHSAAKQDRLKLFNACKTNLSQIFGVFPDEENEVRSILDQATMGVAPLSATDHLGVVHKLWPISDSNTISKLSTIMAPKPTFVADGHHRYETACNYREELMAQGDLPSDHPANFVLMMCIGMSDPGMIVLPTHRLFRGIPEMSSDDLIEKIRGCFDTRIAGEGSDLATMIWDEIATEDSQGTLGLFTSLDERWVVARINEAGQKRLAELASDHSAEWQGLGVSILHRLLVEDLLGQKDLPKPMYVHSVDEVIAGLDAGDTVGRDATGQQGQGGKFPLAALVMPATLDHVREISEHNERMPAKSTYFYPKLLSGLVFNPLS
jgi:uncharacterized protein (DUF1015 family)